MVVIGYKAVRNLEGNKPILASFGYKYSVDASVVSNSKASRLFFFFRDVNRSPNVRTSDPVPKFGSKF